VHRQTAQKEFPTVSALPAGFLVSFAVKDEENQAWVRPQQKWVRLSPRTLCLEVLGHGKMSIGLLFIAEGCPFPCAFKAS